ncbi:MAG: hypothetical protein A3H93_09130 [Rhodocyclales bacterium RIFCSPLOWO2_02_FULL_63_24]|nr:MAG: hypothetical protein A3H93_09130 [Rhodocyclales bacterium RIFCSPLOWO2_02_FULL_63_24]
MNLTLGHLLIAALAGLVIGLTLALHIVERRASRYKEAALHLTVTPEVLNQLNGVMVTAWLDQHGYCWMPKGQEFKWPKEVKR